MTPFPGLSRRSFLGLSASAVAATALSGCSGASTTGAAAGGSGGDASVFLSTQFAPVQEKNNFQAILDTYVKDPKTSFMSVTAADFQTQLKTQVDAKKLQIGIIGALHSDLTPMVNYLDDVDDFVAAAKTAGVSDKLLELGKLGGSTQKYIPWMQATYVVAVNKKALAWLPSGADVNNLTYDQFLQWATNANKASGKPVFGMPAGPKGLYHRFLQGYLLPSFTGGMVSKFNSAEAVTAWTWMQNFWKQCNPASANYEYMQEPLARGEVLVAWDHVARLATATGSAPDQWLMVPAPTGPAGLGYMLVVAGLAVPKGGDKTKAGNIIKALETPDAQNQVLAKNAFFPVVKTTLPSDLSPAIKLEADAVAKQAANAKAIPAVPPVGLGSKDGEFNQVFKDMFREICLQGGAPQAVVTKYTATLNTLLETAKVPCWAPDPAGTVCKVG